MELSIHQFTYICIWIFIGIIIGLPKIHSNDNPSLDDCELPKPELNDEIYNITKKFGNVFYEVEKEIHKLKSIEGNQSVNAVILIGNTGAGKSTLAQLLSGDNDKLQSIEVNTGSGDFIISDGDKIGVETVISKTLYTNVMIDPESGIFICDSPGFMDTRSEIHELVAATSMKHVVDRVSSVKLVLVINHASLKEGSYREDFTNLLKLTVDFVKNTDKYKNSFYLVATKAENSFTFKKGNFVLSSDETVIRNIYEYLVKTKSSLQSLSSSINGKKMTEMINIIESLMQKNSDNIPVRIKILRKPLTEGSIKEIDILQRERIALRDMLLKNDSFTVKNESDFGYSISPRAKLYVNEIFSTSDKKIMMSLSTQISKYLKEYCKSTLGNNQDVNKKLKAANEMKQQIVEFGVEIGRSQRPRDFVYSFTNFTKSNFINYKCSLNFTSIYHLNDYLNYLENFSNTTGFIQNGWNSSFKSIIDFIEVEKENYRLIEDVFFTLTDYEFQNKKSEFVNLIDLDQMQYNHAFENTTNYKGMIPLLTKLGLNNKYASLKPNEFTMKTLNRALQLFVKSDIKISCENEILRIEGYIFKLSDIDYSQIRNCYGLKKLVIFAMHTIYIDKDLKEEELEGKQIIMIARTWHIVGTRKISVDGKTAKNVQFSKASHGEVGRNGKSGGNGGIFIGIGKTFKNVNNLLISANGGDGQNGQDGGDGMDGYDGRNGAYYNSYLSGNTEQIYGVYNIFTQTDVYEGTPGSAGGDSGAGGRGGHGGKKGSVKLIHIGNHKENNEQVLTEVKNGINGKDGKDGKPGTGGNGGCNKVYKTTQKYALFFLVSSNRDVSYGYCSGRGRNGYVRINYNNIHHKFADGDVLTPLDECDLMSDFKTVYDQKYKFPEFAEVTQDFVNEMTC